MKIERVDTYDLPKQNEQTHDLDEMASCRTSSPSRVSGSFTTGLRSSSRRESSPGHRSTFCRRGTFISSFFSRARSSLLLSVVVVVVAAEAAVFITSVFVADVVVVVIFATYKIHYF